MYKIKNIESRILLDVYKLMLNLKEKIGTQPMVAQKQPYQ